MKNKIIKERKNKIVEFDNIKVITVKSSSSKLNINNKEKIKEKKENNIMNNTIKKEKENETEKIKIN